VTQFMPWTPSASQVLAAGTDNQFRQARGQGAETAARRTGCPAPEL